MRLDTYETKCIHHSKCFIDSALEKKFSKNCYVTEKHKKKVRANPKMTVAMAKELETQSIKVLPGWQLHAICYQKVEKSDVHSTTGSDEETTQR